MECPKCHFDNPDDTLHCSNCDTTLPSSNEISVTQTLETPAEELTKGTTLASRYEIMEELGRGGMGRVYKVHDTEIKEKVALKLLKPEIAADKKSIERFRNELKIARKVSHKRVCRMYDIGKEEEKYFITMEYVEGKDLKSLIREEGKISEDEVLRLAKQICEGLVEAHELGIVHRDLKPQNIMIDKEGNAKIMDFGIARSVEAPGVTQTGVIIGTPEYISPEQAEGKEADQRSDIYSLGIILYTMVTGRVPFEGDTALSVVIKHKSQLPKEPRKLNPEVSKDLNRLILICMEKVRERRYQKAEDLLSDLRNIEEGFPLGSKIQPRRMTFIGTLIRNKLFIPAVALLVIAAVIVWQFIPKEAAVQIDPNKASIAIMYFKNNTGDEGLDHWRSAFCQWLMTDLSQSKYIDILPEDKLFSILRKMKLLDENSYATEDLKKIAEEGQVNHIFQASLSKAGDMFRVDYTLQEADNLEVIGSDSVRGEGEKSFPTMVDELTRKIKTNLEFSEKEIATDIDEDIGNITTSVPSAYKYYAEGRKLHLQQQYRQSISFMETAIELDPEFAMAYRSMGVSYISLGKREEALKHFKKALEFINRVSDREKYLIQGSYYDAERNYEKAVEALNKLLEIYPDDSGGNNNLARIYSILGEYEKAKKYAELAYIKNKTSYQTAWGLGDIYIRLGLIDKAIELWENYSNNMPDNFAAHFELLYLYLGKEAYDIAFEEAEKIYALNPKERYWYDIYYLQGDYLAAEKEAKLELEIDGESSQYEARERLFHLYCTQGQFEKAEEQLRKGIKLAEESEPSRNSMLWMSRFHNELAYIYLLKGNLEEALKNTEIASKRAEEYKYEPYKWIASKIKAYAYLKMKIFDEAVKVTEELKEILEKSSPYEKIIQRNMKFYYIVLGKVEFEKGNFSKAIENFKKSLSLEKYDPLYKTAEPYEALGISYYKSGNLQEARKEYERITTLTIGRCFEGGDIYARSFYMLGKIYEQLKKKRKAIEHYEKFLDLWKDADPGIAEVEDAKKRLAGLKSF